MTAPPSMPPDAQRYLTPGSAMSSERITGRAGRPMEQKPANCASSTEKRSSRSEAAGGINMP